MKTKLPNLVSELTFKTSRSGGAGGQNINKVSSKVELDFDVLNSALLTDEQKKIILSKANKKITRDGIMQIISQTERNQLGNKEIAIKKFNELIAKCFVIKKKRKLTKPSKAAKEKRLETKKKNSEIKNMRKKGTRFY